MRKIEDSKQSAEAFALQWGNTGSYNNNSKYNIVIILILTIDLHYIPTYNK